MGNAWQKIRLVLTLRCEEAERIRLRREYGEATRTERLAEVLHRAICGPCKVIARQQRRLTQAIALYRQRQPGAAPGNEIAGGNSSPL